MPELILASSSPRRSELLRRFGLPFRVVPSTIDERSPSPGEAPTDYARSLAIEKAENVYASHPDCLILAADTVVTIDDAILGKPVDGRDARRMLAQLSGRPHVVVTGVAVRGALAPDGVVSATVTMRKYGEGEIQEYVASGEPMDKAGAYAVQGLGGHLVESVRGCLETVIGLPLCLAGSLLLQSDLAVSSGIACGVYWRVDDLGSE